MEQEGIRELLNKYFEGITSEEEEAQLREYLSDSILSLQLYVRNTATYRAWPRKFLSRQRAFIKGSKRLPSGLLKHPV